MPGGKRPFDSEAPAADAPVAYKGARVEGDSGEGRAPAWFTPRAQAGVMAGPEGGTAPSPAKPQPRTDTLSRLGLTRRLQGLYDSHAALNMCWSRIAAAGGDDVGPDGCAPPPADTAVSETPHLLHIWGEGMGEPVGESVCGDWVRETVRLRV